MCAWLDEGPGMTAPDVEEVASHLSTVLARERRDALKYAVLTVLCTPVFVAMGAITIAVILAVPLRQAGEGMELKVIAFYTATNGFLGYMIVFVLAYSRESQQPFEFDPALIAAVVVFVALVLATYLTSQPELRPAPFGALYALSGLLVLGLLGQVSLPQQGREEWEGQADPRAFVLAVSAFIVSAYGELLSSSWLWRSPQPGQIRIAGRFLVRVAEDDRDPPRADLVDSDTINLLRRLRLITAEGDAIRLTYKGQQFLRAAGRLGCSALE
jgi:hypothetical protein